MEAIKQFEGHIQCITQATVTVEEEDTKWKITPGKDIPQQLANNTNVFDPLFVMLVLGDGRQSQKAIPWNKWNYLTKELKLIKPYSQSTLETFRKRITAVQLCMS